MADLPNGELTRRLALVSSRLNEADLDGLVVYGDCWRHSNIGWFTGFSPLDGVGDYPVAVLLIEPGEQPTMFVAAGALGWAQAVTGFPVHPLDELDRQLQQWSPHGRIGLAGADLIPATLRDRLVQGLSGREVGATDVLARCKAVKSDWEIDILRQAAGYTDVAMAAIRDTVATGQSYTERQLARLADAAMITAGADGVAFLSMVQSGPRSEWNLALPTDRVITTGDMVLTDIGARYRGYAADGGRGFTYGQVEPSKIAIVDAAAEAVGEGLAAVRSGIAAHELNAVIQGVLQDRGYSDHSGEARGHGTGHGTGMDPEEEQPWISPDNPLILVPDMVFTLKATITVPGLGGLRTERIVRVTADGAETLDQFPMRNLW